MDKKMVSRLLRKNPRADSKLVAEALAIVKAMREIGVRSDAVLASPPSDPYSTVETERRIRARKQTDQNT